MHIFRPLLIIPVLLGCMVACSSVDSEQESSECGDGLCDVSENSIRCPEDCDQVQFSGETLTTFITSEGIGKIAILVAYPNKPRFSDGAGVVVVIPPFLEESHGFTTEPDFASIGLIQVSFLWPGEKDAGYAIESEGVNDYGGEIAIQALRDVLQFSTGRLPNTEGRLITTLIPTKTLVDEVGIYAYSHTSLAVTNLLALYGDRLKGVEYFVGYENPTEDTLICLETGYWDGRGGKETNPFYQYPSAYDPLDIKLNFGTLNWDDVFTDDTSLLPGRPFLDLDGDTQLSDEDFLFNGTVPVIEGKRFYSASLIQDLVEVGALTLESWPTTLAKPDEALTFWTFRQSISHYPALVLQAPNLKVMLVFSNNDHAQVADDKPHIHQAYQGFRFTSLLRWVRLNPDRSYLQQITASRYLFADNPANTQPQDWSEIVNWSIDSSEISWEGASLAALAEMSDRTHTGRWDENLGSLIYDYTLPTPFP